MSCSNALNEQYAASINAALTPTWIEWEKLAVLDAKKAFCSQHSQLAWCSFLEGVRHLSQPAKSE